MLNYVSGIGSDPRTFYRRSRYMDRRQVDPRSLVADDVNFYGDDDFLDGIGILRRPKATSRQFLKELKVDLSRDGMDGIGKMSRKAKRSARKEERKAGKEERKKIRKIKDKGERKKARKEMRKERGSLIAKVTVAPARMAFLVLVKLNFLKLKDKLKKAKEKNPSKLYQFWAKFGGSKAVLNNTLSGFEEDISLMGLGAIGVLPAVGTALATATPVLVAVAKFLKESGILDKKETGEMDLAIDQGKADLLKDPDISKDFADTEVSEDQVGVVRSTGDSATGETESENGGDSGDQPGFDIKKYILPIGIGAVALLMLTKKK